MKTREASLSHETLTRVLDYNPETGVFVWKAPLSNRVKAGDVAGVLDHHGHRQIKVDGTKWQAHRLAWFYVYKAWPKDEIDHENLVKDDNRIENLREATRSQNNRNVSMKRHNTTGFKGVIRHRQSPHKFVAQITIDGVTRYLGIFNTPEDAHATYVAASIKHHREFGRSN